MMENANILEVHELCKHYSMGKKQVLKAVDEVSFAIKEGETFGIVGESGCGKTTCGKTCIGMLKPTKGEVLYKGKNVHKLSRREYLEFTKEVQMIFQDPYTSLDPHLRVYDIIAEGPRIHHMVSNKEEEKQLVKELLEAVNLAPEYMGRHVHEFSGGQRQRIGIARALSVNPKFIFCDEPISALDVSVQAQIINLMKKLQKERKLTLMFIAHDLSMVRYISDRIGVMYLGNMIEIGEADSVCFEPLHPYSKMLLEAVPEADPKKKMKHISGEAESGIEMTEKTEGCPFYGRCKYRMEKCKLAKPELKEMKPGHFAACHLCEEEKTWQN